MNDLIVRLRDESWKDQGHPLSWKGQGHPLSPAELEVWHKTCCEAADEIERLQSLIDRLPKTADGVPVRPGDQIWFHKGTDTAVIRKVVDGGEYGDIVEIFDAEGPQGWVALNTCHSAREATKAEVQS